MKKVFGMLVVAILAIGFSGCEKADPEVERYINQFNQWGGTCKSLVNAGWHEKQRRQEFSAAQWRYIYKKLGCEEALKKYQVDFVNEHKKHNITCTEKGYSFTVVNKPLFKGDSPTINTYGVEKRPDWTDAEWKSMLKQVGCGK